MHVPQELVDLIVDNLHGDVPSLKSCALAARTFVRSTRIQLFNKVEILPPRLGAKERDSPCQKFYKLLTSSPHLVPLVHELHVVLVGSETSFAYDEDGEYLEERHVPWVMSGRTLASVLPLLDLKRISLIENSPVDWNGWGDFSMNWTRLGRVLKSALAAVFSSPRLESVHLRGIVVQSPAQLLSLFSEATSLKHMSISRVYFTQQWNQRDSWPETQPWRPQLRSLLVSDILGDLLCRHFLHPRIDLTRVTSLTIATENDEWRQKMSQAVVSGATRHLGLYRPHRSETLKSILTPDLSSVRFFTTDIGELMATAFAACPPNSRLEKIVFETSTSPFRVFSVNDTIESALVRLNSLKTVEIQVYQWDDSRPLFHEWAAEVKSLLPSLVGRSLLTLTEIERAEYSPHHGWE